MQTLYLVLHEKQTCSDLRGSVMMVILLQMTLNKCKKKKDKWIIYITGRLTEQQTRQFDNHRGLQSFQFSAKNKSPVFSSERSPKNYSKFVKI